MKWETLSDYDALSERAARILLSDGGGPGTRHLGEGDGVATAAAR